MLWRPLFKYIYVIPLLLTICVLHKCYWENELLAFKSKDYEVIRPADTQQEKPFPDAVIIGAKKAGTTFLKILMRLHPNISIRLKEIHFFDKHFEEGKEGYLRLLPKPKQGKIMMEKTPKYWIHPNVPEQLHEVNPKVKLILTLRDPVCRIISGYFHAKPLNKKVRKISLYDCFMDRKNKHIHDLLIEPSLYDKHLIRWINVFPAKQIMILKNEDLCNMKLKGIVYKLEDFLGIPHVYNVTQQNGKMCISSLRSRRICQKVCSEDFICKYRIAYEEIYNHLLKKMTPHIHNLYNLTGRDFGWINQT